MDTLVPMREPRHRIGPSITQIILLVGAVLLPGSGCRHAPPPKFAPRLDHASLVIVLDGLRPDYVTPELMPNLHALGERGVVSRNHHSVFPTVTRVNAASIATGSYPARHGLMGNSVFFPKIAPDTSFNTGNAAHLQRIEAATDGHLLTVPSLGEVLEQGGRKLLAVSSGSSGSAFLLNHKICGGGIINNGLVLPTALQPRVTEFLGPVPPDASPNTGRNRRAVDAYLRIGLDLLQPNVTLMWLSDPDHTQHENGVGAPMTLEAIRQVDAEIGRVLATLAAKGLQDQVNIFVTSDHGFSTHTGKMDLPGLLKPEVESGQVFVVEGAIYVKHHDAIVIRHLVKRLQATDWAGAIFTRPSQPGQPKGAVPGTLSFDLAHWTHPRAADILVAPNWTDATNQYGYRGTSTQKDGEPAGHGTSSPYDVHNTLVAAGPDIKSGVVSDVPSGNVDFAPTLCFLNGIRPPDTMDGRVLKELLRGGPAPAEVRVQNLVYRTQAQEEDGEYQLTLSCSIVSGTEYLNFTRVKRESPPHPPVAEGN
ncbi:MAG: alkaline phosphatase family protein [Verrucomicrobiota bacterium]|nr:alkaline phosphatase family protein [Verrucomicrobiota bacterium]